MSAMILRNGATTAPTIQAAIRPFGYACQARGLSPRTVKTHIDWLQLLDRRLPGVTLDRIDREQLRQFLANSRWSQATRLLVWKSLGAFFRFCVEEGILNSSPMDGIERPRKAANARKPPRYTSEDLEALLAACPSWTWIGMRDQAILQVLWSTPARTSELALIRVTDIDWERSVIRLYGKGGAVYDIVLFPKVALAIDRYLRARPATEHPALWLTQTGAELQPNALRLILQRLRKRSGFSKPLYVHAGRHNFGIRTVEWGLATDEAMHAMGHRSDAATKIYRQWAAGEHVLEKIRAGGAGVVAP